jgi:hypothetical protein
MKRDIINAIGRAFRQRNAELTATPLPGRWRDIINDIDFEDMLVGNPEREPPHDLANDISRALERLKQAR